MNQLILSMILTVLPISELRGGLPLAINYAIKNNLSVLPVFLMIVSLNIMVVPLVLIFLDIFNERLLKIKIYKKLFDAYIARIRKKTEKLEKSYSSYGFLALSAFVAVPLPVTGAWTGAVIAWLLGLERKKSIAAISFGVAIAGVIVLLASLGVINLFR